jgi:hypothetical protein
MPQQGINFGGFYIWQPGAYYQDNVSAAASDTPPVTPPLIFIGYGYGPKPKTPQNFVSAANLLSALRGGPAAAFAPFISQPSPTLYGTSYITFIDASQNTQSALTLTNSVGSGAVVLTSTMYGPPSNLLQSTVAAASVSGVKLTLYDGYANVGYTGDNLGFPFQLAYAGASTGVTYNCAPATGAASGLFVLSSPVSGQSYTFAIGSGGYQTVAQLVAAINGTSYYVAQSLSSTGGQLPTNLLTTVSGTLTASTGAYNYVAVPSAQDVPFWVNQFASALASGVLASGASNTAAYLPALANATYFTGARGVPPQTADYATALNAALQTPGWVVFCDSNATAVQALLAQHCITASTPPYGMWRRGFTGSSVGDNVTTTIANAQALDAIQMAYLYPGIYRVNTQTGQNTLYSGLYAAAAAAGMACANQIAQPLTNKPLNATGVEVALTQSQLQQLQNAGVMCVYVPQNGVNGGVPTIMSDVTTWQVDNNPENTSSQQVACRFWLAYTVVAALSPWVGSIASTPTEALILQSVIRALNALIFTGGASNGVLNSWDRNSLSLVYTGSNMVAAVTFNATPVGQNRYITVTVPIQQLNITVTTASVPGA